MIKIYKRMAQNSFYEICISINYLLACQTFNKDETRPDANDDEYGQQEIIPENGTTSDIYLFLCKENTTSYNHEK